MSKVIKKILPPFLIRYIRGLFYGWYGNFRSWEHAEKKCTGYDSEIIFNKVKDAARQVKNGDAAFERDSVLFHEPDYSKTLAKAIKLILSAKNAKKINVLDFGGSLGSTYFQNRENIGKHWM